MSPTKKLLLLLFSFCYFCINASAQTNNPYTRYGLGTLSEPEFSFLRGWGDMSAAYHNSFNINFANPASYSDIKLTIFEAGAFGSLIKIRNKDSAAYFGDGSVANLALGFPIVRNKLGMSIGIVPFSTVDYSVGQTNDSSADYGMSYNLFQGSGGLYRFYGGIGYKIGHLAIGVNASYLFGQINYSDLLFFPDTLNAYNTRKQEFRAIRDFLFNAGVQYQFLFGEKKEYALDIGVTGNLNTNIATRRNLLYERFIYRDIFNNPTLTPNPKDTIYSVLNEKGSIVLPASVSGGIIFSKINHYSVGLNFKYNKWSDFRTYGASDLTTDSWKAGVGTEIIPDYKAYQQYWKQLTYRLGFQYGIDYLKFDGKELPQSTLSIGVGFPLKRIISQIALSGEWTHTGTLNKNPLEISYFRFTAGFTLNDKWFQKRKFD